MNPLPHRPLPPHSQTLVTRLPDLLRQLGVSPVMLPVMLARVQDWQTVEDWCLTLKEAWHDR